MNKWNIRVHVPYSTRNNSAITAYSYTPSGCFRGSYSYRIDENDSLILLHGDGETYLGGGWSDSYIIESFRVENLTQCDPIHYDCLNGICVEKKAYNTPGIFKSLSECETACGTGCSGQCIPNDEWNKIQSLANQLKNKNCS